MIVGSGKGGFTSLVLFAWSLGDQSETFVVSHYCITLPVTHSEHMDWWDLPFTPSEHTDWWDCFHTSIVSSHCICHFDTFAPLLYAMVTWNFFVVVGPPCEVPLGCVPRSSNYESILSLILPKNTTKGILLQYLPHLVLSVKDIDLSLQISYLRLPVAAPLIDLIVWIDCCWIEQIYCYFFLY